MFLGFFGQVWCENVTDEAARLSALTNPHSPGKDRVNGVVQNMPEFQKAFACRMGQPMVRRLSLPRMVIVASQHGFQSEST